MSTDDHVPHDDFAAGFKVGWQTIKGTSSGVPGTPGRPGTPGNKTPFLVGVKKGIERATGKSLDD